MCAPNSNKTLINLHKNHKVQNKFLYSPFPGLLESLIETLKMRANTFFHRRQMHHIYLLFFIRQNVEFHIATLKVKQ